MSQISDTQRIFNEKIQRIFNEKLPTYCDSKRKLTLVESLVETDFNG
jgi:hypothetical protein